MLVKDIMTSTPVYVTPETSIEDIARVMRDCDIGSVPVADNNLGLIGIVTDRDIVLRSIAGGGVCRTAQDIMSKSVSTVSPNTNVKDATKLMSDQQIRRLPVVDDNKLVGIVALGDLALSNSLLIETSKALSDISETDKK